ncbi:MAG: hypothetical protein FWJ62_08440 [Thermaerobacter sp.]|nr:hypothetical protein [Bacillota bacterium]
MRAFAALLRKELRQHGPTALAFAGVLIAWAIVLYNFKERWDDLIPPLLILPMGFTPLWFLWRAYQSLRAEWSGRHAHLLLALPVPGWYLTLSKFLVLLLEVGLYAAVHAGAIYLVAVHDDLRHFSSPYLSDSVGNAFIRATLWTAFRTVLLLVPHGILILAAAYGIIHVSWLASRLLPLSRGRRIVSVLILAGLGWMMWRGAWLLGLALSWLPRIPVAQGMWIEGRSADALWLIHSTVTVAAGPVVGLLLLTAALYAAGSWLLEREVEL